MLDEKNSTSDNHLLGYQHLPIYDPKSTTPSSILTSTLASPAKLLPKLRSSSEEPAGGKIKYGNKSIETPDISKPILSPNESRPSQLPNNDFNLESTSFMDSMSENQDMLMTCRLVELKSIPNSNHFSVSALANIQIPTTIYLEILFEVWNTVKPVQLLFTANEIMPHDEFNVVITEQINDIFQYQSVINEEIPMMNEEEKKNQLVNDLEDLLMFEPNQTFPPCNTTHL